MSLPLSILLTISCLTQTHAQFTTSPEPGCPIGYDCIGQELSPYLAQHINCLAPSPLSSEFEGYTCNLGSAEADDYPTLAECPSGYYCPTPSEKYQCPSGHWCHRGSKYPEPCLDGSAFCPSGSSAQQFFSPLFVTIGVLVLCGVLYKYVHARINARVASEKHRKEEEAKARKTLNLDQLQQTTIQVKGLGNNNKKVFNSYIQPKLNLDFKDVCVSVKDSNPDPSGAQNNGEEKKMKTILNNITGTVRGGRLTAVMGPSGSGKTTFLSALLAKIPISSGKILINHQHTVEEVIKMNIVGYVPQADVMLSMLTVRDLISHSAYMRLPATMSSELKLQRIAAVMELLGITEIADSVVGDDMNRGISGGQKKRVSIAMELVADPLILFLDEPTSGLDSAAAQQVCDGLLSIAQQSRVVCCVIHQPRWEIFSKFQDVLLLGKGGFVVYFGPVSNIRDYFAAMGFVPPANTNPADFYLDTISENDFLTAFKMVGYEGMVKKAVGEGKALGKKGDGMVGLSNSKASEVRFHYDASMVPSETLEQQHDIDVGISKSNLLQGEEEKYDPTVSHQASLSMNTNVAHSNDDPTTTKKLKTRTSHAAIIPNEAASIWTQFIHLLYRNLLIDCRQAKYVLIDCFLQCLPAIGLGIGGLGEDDYYSALPQSVANTCLGVINERCQTELTLNHFTSDPFYYGMIIGVGAMMWATFTFGRVQNIFFRDRISGQSTLAYFLAKIVYDLGHMFRMLMIFISIFFLMKSVRGGWGYWFLVCGMTFYASMGLMYFVSVVIPFQRAAMVGVVCAVCLSVTSGLSPSLNTVRDWNILRVFWYLSYNRWAAEAFIIIDTVGQDDTGRINHAIDASGYDSGNLSVDIGLVFLIGCLWRAATFVALLRSKPRTEF